MWKKLALLVLALGCAQQCLGDAHPCCEGPNVLKSKLCWNDRPVDLACEKKYLLDPDFDAGDSFVVTDDGALQYQLLTSDRDIIVPKSEYCLARLESRNGTEVAVVCANGPQDEGDDTWFTLRSICAFLSVFFLLLTLLVYALVPNLRDLQGKCIVHAIAALAVSMLNLGILQLANLNAAPCLFFSYMNYIAFMTTFFWLNVTSFHVWKTAVKPNMMGTDRQWYYIYLLYGHGMPTLMLCILAIANHSPGDHIKPNLGISRCWFNGSVATWAYFYGPISFLLCVNLILFLFSIKAVWREAKNANEPKMRSLRFKVRLYVRLFLIMGLLWSFEVISAALDNVHPTLDYIWILTDYMNALQGALIFSLLIVFRKRALRGLANKALCCFQFPGMWKTLEDEEILDELENEDEVRMSNEQN